MKLNLTRSIQRIFILTFIINLTSCSIGYNSITYSRSDDNVSQSIETIRHKKKWSKTTFIHTPDTLYQTNNLSYYGGNGEDLLMKGESVPIDMGYSIAYSTLKLKKKNQESHQEIAGRKGKYFKQTHIYTDKVTVDSNIVQINSADIKKATSYHRRRLVLFILLGVLALPIGLILALIIGIAINGINLGGAFA